MKKSGKWKAYTNKYSKNLNKNTNERAEKISVLLLYEDKNRDKLTPVCFLKCSNFIFKLHFVWKKRLNSIKTKKKCKFGYAKMKKP